MKPEIYSLCEAVHDISTTMEAMGFCPPDSRERAHLPIEWAEEFEALNCNRDWDGEYIEEIDDFAAKKINEEWGGEE